MTLNQIRYFLAVAERGSFSAAARTLNLSQPALCYQLQTLEEGLQVILLERHSRGVRLTQAGQALLGPARNVMEAVSVADQSIGRFRNAPIDLMLGVAPTPGRTLLPDLMDFASRDNTLRLVVRQGLSDELNNSVAAGEIDAALCYNPVAKPRTSAIPLYSEDLFLVGTRQNIRGEGETIAFDELARIPLVSDGRLKSLTGVVANAAKERGVQLDLIEIEPIDVRREVMLRTGRAAIVPYGLFLDEIKTGLLTARLIVEPTMSRTMNLLMHDRFAAPGRASFVKLVTDLVARRIEEGGLKWRAAAAEKEKAAAPAD
jgi:LysR family nitrogen assimilation transcriptional regulator